MSAVLSPLITRAVTQKSIGYVRGALAGGAATSAFFQAYNGIQQLNAAIAANPNIWQPSGVASATQQAKVASAGGAQLVVAVNLDQAGAPASAPPAFTFNGQSYDVVGSTQIYYTSGNFDWLSTAAVGLVGYATQSMVSSLVQSAMSSLVSAGNAATSSVADAAAAGGSAEVGGADAAATEAAGAGGDAVAGGAAVAEGVGLAAMAGLFIGLIAAAAVVYLIEEFILHVTTHRVTVVNLTDYPITWSIAYNSEGNLTSAPSMPVGQSPSEGYTTAYVIPGQQSSAPPGDVAVPVYSMADFQFTSANSYSGLGYVMQFAFTDGSGNAYAPACMFDLPFTGDNSMATTFAAQNWSQWYSDNEGGNTALSNSSSSANGVFTITSTYDFNDGEHSDPTGQNTGYFYNSVIVIDQIQPQTAAELKSELTIGVALGPVHVTTQS
jgi:hypothetical protein